MGLISSRTKPLVRAQRVVPTQGTPPKPARINLLPTAQTIAMQEILPQEGIVRLTTAQTIAMQETFPQLATVVHLTRLSLKTHFHHCRHQCLLSVHSNVNWTQPLDPHCLLLRRTRKPPDSHSQSSLNQNTATHYHLYLRTSFHHHQQLAHL